MARLTEHGEGSKRIEQALDYGRTDEIAHESNNHWNIHSNLLRNRNVSPAVRTADCRLTLFDGARPRDRAFAAKLLAPPPALLMRYCALARSKLSCHCALSASPDASPSSTTASCGAG